ncbi:MAG: PcfJ domain-containing protein [Halochromatium sp.]|uniref:PcfJ domain-containing protein n=1 Tax=Halochromatium sp. TaxID=2049430 RepID=UPI00397DFA95
MIGDDSTNQAAAALLRQLFRSGLLREYRACLYRDSGISGMRQALSINLGSPLGESDALGTQRGLWLVEQDNRKLFLYGLESPCNPTQIGGTVMQGKPVLEPDSAWMKTLANALAARVLGRQASGAGLAACPHGMAQSLLARVEHAILRAAIAAFSQSLRADVVAILQREGQGDWDAYNFYLDAAGHPNRNRLQAAHRFPFFSQALRTDWRLRQQVDRGAPLVRTLADVYQTQRRTIQHCRHFEPMRIDQEHRATLLAQLDQLPVEYLPKTDADHRVFRTLWQPLVDLAAVLQRDVRELAAPFAQGWAQGHRALTDKLGAALDFDAIYAFARATYRYSLYPALEAELAKRGQAVEIVEDPPVAFFAAWFGQVGLRRLAQMALQWRDAYRQFSLDRLGLCYPKAAASLEWSRIIENASGHSHGHYRMIELTSRQALELEGREQEHCVASYAVKCLTGDSALFSIRARTTGKILSTFEVDLRRDNPVLIKHYAKRNETPEPPLQAVGERFVQRVLQPISKQRLSAIRDRRRSTGAAIIQRLDSPDSLEPELNVQDQHKLAEMLAFTLPAQARRQGLVQFLERNGLLKLFIQNTQPKLPQVELDDVA